MHCGGLGGHATFTPSEEIDYENDSVEKIVEQLEYAIEQHPSFLKVIPQEELEEKERLNRELRDW